MNTPWYKLSIETLLSRNACRNQEPYCYWRENLFDALDPALFTDVVTDECISVIASVAGTLERVVRTVYLWGDLRVRGVVHQARILTLAYLCYVYPKENVFTRLAERLPDDSDEGRICRAISATEGEFRHIRNSLAHGTFEFETTSAFVGIAFTDRHWHQRLEYWRIEIDCLIIIDMLMSAYGRRLGSDELTNG